MQLFNMKPYLTFLSRNKVYALINVFGLSISLMFVLLIGVYNMQERSVDHGNSKFDRIYTVNMKVEDSILLDGNHHYVQKLIRQFCPEVIATAGAGLHDFNMKRPDGEVLKTNIMVVDTALFSILDFHFVEGNAQKPLPDNQSAIITQSFAKRWFGDYNPLGKTIVMYKDISFRVSAVIEEPANMSLKPADMYIAYPNMKYFNEADMDEYMSEGMNACGMDIYVLTNGKTDLRTKEAALNKYLGKNFELYDEKEAYAKAVLTPLSEHYFAEMKSYNNNTRHGDAQMVNLLFAVGVVILLFAMINYVNLTVSQSGYRAREMATRRLFGGSRLSVITQLMGESIMMCLLSLVIAALLSCAAAPVVSKLLACKLDLTLLLRPLPLLLTLLFVVIVGSLSGILPSVILSRTKPIEIVRGTFRFRTKQRLSKVFIVVQNVVTIVMLGAALTMTMQMQHIVNAPLGFNTKNIMDIPFAISDSTMNRAFMQELKKLPCVVNCSACDFTPVEGGNNITKRNEAGNPWHTAQFFHVDSAFLNILGMKIAKDYGVATTPRVWINKMYAAEWADDLKGKHSISEPFSKKEYPIAGVLADFRLKNITNPMMSVMIFEEKDVFKPGSYYISHFLVQVAGDPVDAFNVVKSVYKEMFHMDMKTDNPYIDQQIASKFDRELRISKIVVLFAFIAIVISLLGLIAMSTYFIQQRQKEIAVRKVFGSTGTQIRHRLIASFMAYVALAVIIAVPITWYAMGQWIATYSYRITFWPWIALSCVICALISLAAVYVQSYMAGNVNPSITIKENG